MRRLIPVGLLAGAAFAASTATASAFTIDDVVWMIQNSGGRYVPAGASLSGADCSGLVSVAQSLAMGQQPHRLGNTTSLLAGRWPGVVPGASPGDRFIIGVNAGHMVAQIDGVNIESTTSGQPYRVGAGAASPWSGPFQVYHVDPTLLVTAQRKVEPEALPVAPISGASTAPVPEEGPPPPIAEPVAADPPPQADPVPPLEVPSDPPAAMDPVVGVQPTEELVQVAENSPIDSVVPLYPGGGGL